MLFTIAVKNKLVYRFDVLFSILGSVLYIAMNILLWRYLYRNDPEMVDYMTAYTILSNMIAMAYSRNISGRIGTKVSSGDYVIDLLRPKNFFTMAWQTELAEITVDMILRGVPTILVFLPFLQVHFSVGGVLLALLAVVMGHVLNLLIYSLIGFSAFALIEIWPITRLVGDTIRLLAGSFLPLSIMPVFLQKIAYMLPFRFLYAFPLELLLGDVETGALIGNFVSMAVWIAVFAALNFAMYNIAKYKAVVQGG